MKKASGERRERFVHLGERLACIERIRAGETTFRQAAEELEVDEAQVYLWMELHGNDRLVTINELRLPSNALNARLASRARRLAQLLLDAERRVRELHLELISKEFGVKAHRGSEGVARAQPRSE
jgi:hypothetical protein